MRVFCDHETVAQRVTLQRFARFISISLLIALSNNNCFHYTPFAYRHMIYRKILMCVHLTTIALDRANFGRMLFYMRFFRQQFTILI